MCRELDGMPLAIELAAARVEMFSVQQIAAHLTDRFRLLANGFRTAAPRHQTLWAVVAWSYALLDEPQQRLLTSLSVFAGWTLEAAEAITAAPGLAGADVSVALGQLIAASLVEVEHRDGHRRYRLLETIRQFAAEQLHRSADQERRIRTRHRDWYLDLAERFSQSIPGSAENEAMDLLEAELGNLRRALDSCSSDSSGLEPGMRAAGRLWWFWYTRSHWTEARGHLERFLAQSTLHQQSAARAEVLFALGSILRNQGELEAARALLQESLTIQRVLGDPSGQALVLSELGRVVRAVGEYDSAWVMLEESRALYEQLGNHRRMTRQLNGLGALARMRGDLDRAQEWCERSLSLNRSTQDHMGMWIDWCH